VFTPSYVRAGLLTGLLLLVSCKSDRDPANGKQGPVFAAASDILDQAALSEGNGIPDAVLNRTRCFALIPPHSVQGVMSCYEALNHWTRPDLVFFKGRRAPSRALFVFVLGQNEAKMLRTARLKVGSAGSSSPGPLVRSKSVITDADLNFGSLLYEREDDFVVADPVQGEIFPVSPIRPSGITSKVDQQLQRSLASFSNVITPAGIIIHHTAVLPSSGQVPSGRDELDSYHLKKGFDVVCFGREYHVAYHYLVLANGQVQAGRPERCQGGHATGYNAYIGISVAGDFSSKDNPTGEHGSIVPSAEQQQALVQLCRRLLGRYKIPFHRIMRHSDVAATECPGDRFPFVRVLEEVGQ
jgi:hypothetical protein